MTNIEYSSKFVRLYKKLPIEIKKLAEARVCIFKAYPFDEKLETHKLSGRLSEYWAFWIDRKYRIIFSFNKDKSVRFHSVGDHSIYRSTV